MRLPRILQTKFAGRLLRRTFHTYWRFSRGMTLGVRAAVIDRDDRVFLIRHTYVPGWQLPGGGVEPGETMEMPVSYFVDPEIVKDADARRINTITLSYTFYEVKKPAATTTDATKAKDAATKPRQGT